MSRARLQSQGAGQFRLEGVLDFASVAALARETDRLFQGTGVVELDLAQVQESNSAGLVLLLTWWEAAKRRNRNLRFHHLPESLERLALLTDLDTLLPQAGEGDG